MSEAQEAYDLLPAALLPTIPGLYSTQNQDDPVAQLKWFTPDSSWTWYVLEYDPDQGLCFGLVYGHAREFGYFDLAELRNVRGPLGLPIERDLHFTPRPVSQCK